MKIELFIVAVTAFAFSSGAFVPPRHGHKTHPHLLGAKECTWGPSYWCQNLTAAADCHAVPHCIQTVWIHKKLPPDQSSICQTCLDMVKQARDQLESNETQELIKEVFEGSCALIHIKPVVKECDKIADQYIPELIDTLASQMNPQVVCSVAGLCNNEKFQKLIADDDTQVVPTTTTTTSTTTTDSTCDGCHTVVGLMEKKFNQQTRDAFLQNLLQICGKTGSLSDACSNIIITYFSQIYNHIKTSLNPTDFCLMAGECSAQFHTHVNAEITPISHIGYVPVGDKDNLPCDLCTQLVGHLRDLLVANTTESEFKLVLQGLCKQTNQFKDECLALVDEYYPQIYQFLINELNASAICSMIGICPGNSRLDGAPIIPLLPVETVPKALEITPSPNKNIGRINMAKDGSSVEILERPEEAQLPIDLLMPPHTQVVYNKELCVFCEYFLHYLQEAITNPKSEAEIKSVIDKACSKLPSSVNASCIEFVETYEPALVAILAQEIDPSQVCPLIKACPASDSQDVEVFMQQQSEGSKCPLCLFAVERLEQMVTDKKTEANIKEALNKLCSHLPNDLADECNDFVNTYTNELVEMLMADLSPQEVCVYLHLCNDTKKPINLFVPAAPTLIGGDIETNSIPDNTINGQQVERFSALKANPQCVLCEFVVKEIQDQLKENKTEEDIKKAVRHVCQIMPQSIRTDCNNFLDEYGDAMIQLLIEMTVPEELCRVLKLCDSLIQEIEGALRVEVLECAVCEGTVYAMEKILENPSIDHNVHHVVEKACRALPRQDQVKCREIIDKYGKTIYDLVVHLANKGLVCHEIGLCSNKVARPKRQVGAVGGSPCTWGPSYWCDKRENAEKCDAVNYCETKVWKN